MLREEICFPGKINSVTISQDGDKFFASFSIETSEIIYEATHRENVRRPCAAATGELKIS